MSKPFMFLAMILANAKRVGAKTVVLTVEQSQARIELLLSDGASQPLAAPPPEVLIQIMESLEQGQRSFSASVFTVEIDDVQVQRGVDSMTARIASWQIGHCP